MNRTRILLCFVLCCKIEAACVEIVLFGNATSSEGECAIGK